MRKFLLFSLIILSSQIFPKTIVINASDIKSPYSVHQKYKMAEWLQAGDLIDMYVGVASWVIATKEKSLKEELAKCEDKEFVRKHFYGEFKAGQKRCQEKAYEAIKEQFLQDEAYLELVEARLIELTKDEKDKKITHEDLKKLRDKIQGTINTGSNIVEWKGMRLVTQV